MDLNDLSQGPVSGGLTFDTAATAASDSLYASHRAWEAERASFAADFDAQHRQDDPFLSSVNYADGEDPTALHLGRTRDLYQLDLDPFGEKTVRYGEQTGMTADFNSDTVAGASVFGKELSADTLRKTDAGRRLLEITERNRRGVKRGFLEAVTDFQLSDVPFLSLFATVGGSIRDAATVSGTMKKLMNGDPVTDDELIKTRLYMAEQDYRSNGTWGATVGDIIRAAPGFMVEFFASGGLYSAARAGASKAAGAGIHLGLSRATKILAREATDFYAKEAVGKAAAKAGARAFADLAGDEAKDRIVSRVAEQVVSKTMVGNPLYRGLSAEAMQDLAKNRAEYEFSRMLARNAGGAMRNNLNRFSQWLGQNVSRGLMDFGQWGTEESTVLFTNHSRAGRALADAVGTFFVEAPIRGALLMAPNAYGVAPLVAKASGIDRPVSDAQLSLQRSALQTGNRELMANAESIAQGMNLLEYVSENTGRGLKSLVRAGGLGLERLGVKGLVKPASPAVLGIVPESPEMAVSFGGKIRQWIGDVFGTREDFLKKAQGEKLNAVVRALGVTDAADRSALNVALLSGSSAGLRPELREAVGGSVEEFADRALRKMYDDGVRDLQYKSYARFAVANWMARHQVGPETVMNMYERMGYDGILGEMFEERYSDVVKGMLGLDDRAEHDFFSNLKEAVKGLYPGWDQLTAEAVGFAMPMVTRAGVLRLQSAIGGEGRLRQIRTRLEGIEDALRHDSAVSMKYGTYLAAHDALAKEDAAEIEGLGRKLEAARAAGNESEVRDIEETIAERTKVSRRREERHQKFVGSLADAAKADADSIVNVPLLPNQVLADDAANAETPALTSEQAGASLEGQAAIVDYAPELARVLYDAEAPLEGESESWYRRAAHKIVGLAGAIVSGDMSLAATNPAQWTARDMGLSANVCRALKEGYRQEFRRQAKSIRDARASAAAESGEAAGSFSVSRAEVADAASAAFAPRAKQIMGAYLAAHQLRSFSDGRMKDQAIAHVAKSEGYEYFVADDGAVSFAKVDEETGRFVEGAEVSAADFYESHRELVDETHEKLAVATADILTRRLTKSFDADMRILNMVRLPASSDVLDAAIYDCALHMIGGQNLAYVQSIDGGVPLADAIYSSSVGRVNMKVVDYIAGFSSAGDPGLDRRALESVAWSLGLRFDGTEEGLAKRDEKIFAMAKLATMLDRGDVRHFSRPTTEAEDESRLHSKGTVGLTARLNDKGEFEVDFGIRQKGARAERDVRTFGTEEALTEEMAKLGYLPTRSRLLLSQAKTLESTDMFHMIRELDLAPEYLAAFGARPRQDRVHPMLRRDSSGSLLSEDAAREVLAKELAVAEHWDPSSQTVVGDVRLSENTVRRTWENLWGDGGYMRIGERMLADRGVKTDTMAKYAGEFDAYAPRRYTLSINVGKLSKDSADFVVPVDPRVNPDMTSGLVNGVLMRAYATHGRLLRNALNGTVSDFAHEVDAIVENAMEEATAAHDAELVRSLAAFRRSCTTEIDREARTSDGRVVVRRGVGLTPEGFVTLAGAFCAYQAEKYADSPYLRAVAKIAPAVRRAASFMDFTNLVDLTLGGNGFLDAAVENAARVPADVNAQRGLRRLVSYANGSADAFRSAVRSSLPGGLSYSAFLDGCIRRMAAMARSGAPTITEQEKAALRESARRAEDSRDETMHDHFTFVGQLYGVVKRVVQSGAEVNASTAGFFQKVAEDALAQDVGSTEQQKTALRAAVRDMQKAASVDAANNEYVQVRTQYEESVRQVDRLRSEVVRLRKKLVAAQKAKDGVKTGRTADAVADAQTRLDKAANALSEKRRELDAAGGATRSLMKGGRTTGDTNVEDVQDYGSADDVPTFAVGDASADLPSAFGERAKAETRGFWEKYGAETIEGRQFTRRQARLAVNVVVRAFLASNPSSEGVAESDVVELAGRMFPALVPEEVEDIRTAFRVADGMRIRSGADWADFATSGERWSFSQDDKDEDDTSSDNYNDQALNEYNSEAVADFLALAQRTSPETGRNLQGFLRLSREASRRAFERIEVGFSDDPAANARAAEAVTFLYNLLNPKMNAEGSTQAEHDALHHETLAKFDDTASPASRFVPALLETSEGRPISRRGAFLVAYLSALPRNARVRFGKLMAHSISASPVRFVKGARRMAPAFRAAHGKVGENIVTDSFVSLVGKSRDELREVSSNLRALVEYFRGTKDFMPVTKTADYRAVLDHNAEMVAEILATEFGTESPLYTALVSEIAVGARAGLSDKRVYDLARSVSFLENKKGQKADVDLVESVCATIDALAASGAGPVTRSEVATAFTATFATGNPTRSSLREAKRSPSVSDPLMTFLTTFTDALPVTIMTAEIDQSRDSRGSSVAVAPRDMVPIISRWLYERADASGKVRARGTSFAEVCAKAFGVTDRETLDRCRQDACWPDERRTPIVAKNISVSYDNVELREACRRSFEDDPSSPCYWVPIYAGDHSSSVFLQVPRSVRILPNGKFAKAATELKPEDNPTYAGRLGQVGGHVLSAKGKYTQKDQDKFNQLGGITRFIGFGPGSTGDYARDFAGIANTGRYTSTDVVGVSVNGRRKGRVSVNSKEYQDELGKAVKAGALIVADTAESRASSTYNIGEAELADYLSAHGYLEIGGSGVWAPAKGADTVTYDDLSKGISKALGLDLMFTDAKRSAISSLEAQGTGMIGTEARDYPDVSVDGAPAAVNALMERAVRSGVVTPVADEYRGKVIFAQSGTGKTMVADNHTVIDGDAILGALLGVETSQAGQLLGYLATMAQADAVKKAYRETARRLADAGKTVLVTQIEMLRDDKGEDSPDGVDLVVLHNDVEDFRKSVDNDSRTNRIDTSAGAKDLYTETRQLQLETWASKFPGKAVRLGKGKHLSDVLLTDKKFSVAAARTENGTATKMIAEFLDNFGISIELLGKYDGKEPFFDVVNRTIHVHDASELPAECGKAVAFMMQYSPAMNRVLLELMVADGVITREEMYRKGKDGRPTDRLVDVSPLAPRADAEGGLLMATPTRDTFQHKAGKYFKIAGRLIAAELMRMHGAHGKAASDAATEKIVKDVLFEFYDRVEPLKPQLRLIAALARHVSYNIVMNNPGLVRSNIYKPGERDAGPVRLLDWRNALDANPYEADIVRRLTKEGIILTGSTAIATQAKVYRPAENPMHDIDFVCPASMTKEQLDEAVKRSFDTVLEPYEPIDDRTPDGKPKGGTVTYSYLVVDRPAHLEQIDERRVPVKGTDRFRTEKVYAVVEDSTGRRIGQTVGRNATFEPGVKGKALDFFVSRGGTAEREAYRFTYNGAEYAVSNAADTLAAKVAYERVKDIFDYNRFVPHDYVANDVARLFGEAPRRPAPVRRFGENRVHILKTFRDASFYADNGIKGDKAERKFDKLAAEAWKGSTFLRGYAADALKEMAQDPQSSTLKAHVISTQGEELFFGKSLSVATDEGHGQFLPGSSERVVMDYLASYRGADRISTDLLTDFDSYKIGPANSKAILVGDQSVMEYVFSRLEALAKSGRRFDKTTGDELDQLVGDIKVTDLVRGKTESRKLSRILPGVVVNSVDGLSGAGAIDVSYQENGAMAYTVANVSHKSGIPAEPGRTPRNYEVDALTMATALARGDWFGNNSITLRNVYELVANWGLVANTVYTDPRMQSALRRQSVSMLELERYGESHQGQNMLEELARMVWAKTREASNLPLVGVDAPLVSNGSFCDDAGKVYCHSTSEMHRAMMQGSEIFTESEARFFGVPRRMALCNVNVSSNGFRYGWFLDEERFASEFPGEAEQSAARAAGTPGADTRDHATALAIGAVFTRLRDAQKAWEKSRASRADDEADRAKDVRDLREKISRCFKDHHGQYVSDRGDNYVARFGFEDLFMADAANGGANDVFDLSAVQFGDDRVHNDATGQRHVFLGGTMFGLPRTPSYNGSMWLQTVRAGLPVTEVEYEGEDRETGAKVRRWRVGRDAMVSPDPTTNAILGCDHDGDKTKLYMFSVEGDGMTRFTPPPAPHTDGAFSADAFVNDPDARSAYLAQLADGQFLQKCVWNDETQQEEEVPNGTNPDGWYYKVAEPVRKRVSNELVRSLFNMARRLPTEGEEVDGSTGRAKIVSRVSAEGRPRNKFLGGIASSPTKAFPVNDKKSVTRHALPKVLDERHTIGDPDAAAKASAGALDASNARATIVSLAKSLHLAWASGFFTEAEKNVFSGNTSPSDWFRFMYHVDGLSNATFDDMKEQMCGRLGWTSDMMDTVITELLVNAPGGGTLPTTDAEFAAVLSSYSEEVKNKGRFHFMLRASRVSDEDMLGDVRTLLYGGARVTKSAVAGAFGISGDGSKDSPYTVEAPATVGSCIAKAIETVADGMLPHGGRKALGTIVRGAAAKHGSNPVSGYLYWLCASTFPERSADAAVEDGDAVVRGLVGDKKFRDFCEWTLRRSMLMDARSFANSVNYLGADPGDDAANGRRDRVAESFSGMVEYLGEHPVSRGNAVIMLPNNRTYDLLPAFERMHAATRLAYEVGDGLRTVAARAIAAAERRNRTTFAEQFRDAKWQGAAKQRVLAKLLLRDGVESWDRMTLESNAQQLPYVCGLFRSMADLSTEVADTPVADGRALYRSLKATAEGVRSAMQYLYPKAKFSLDPSVLEMRQGVEALFTIMYELMSTSREYNSAGGNKAIAYVRLAADAAYDETEDFNDRTGRLEKHLPYGVAGKGLRRLVANFQANDDESIGRIRAAFGDIIEGRAFTGTRHHNEAQADRSSAIARTFSVSRESVEAFITETLGAAYRDKPDEERLAALKPETRDLVIKARGALIGLESVLGEGVAVTPSMMFGQLLPAYTVLTSRTLGAPTPQSPSILNLLPGRYYESLSDAEAALNGADEGLVDLLVSTNWAPKNALRRRRLADLGSKTKRRALAVTNYDDAGYDELASRVADEVEAAADEEDFIPALSGKLAEIRDQWRQGAGTSEGRSNPDFRNSCDIFAEDVFADVLDYMEDGWGDGYRRSLPDSEPARAGALAAGTAAPEPVALKAEYDPKVAKVALAMSSLLGSWASVEYRGGSTFTIRGRLRGDAGANRNVVITVDASEGPLCDTPEQVAALASSPEYAASLCASADLGITAADFMRMAPEIREALVRKYGVGGATANGVAMSVTGRGLATLAGAIRLPADGGTKIYHEYFHAMMRMFDACNLFSDADRAALAAEFNEDGSGEFTTETEERMAEGFRKWVEGNTDATQESRSVFRRIFDFIKGFFEALARGFDYDSESYDTIFKMVVHGIAQTSDSRRAELLGPGYAALDQAAVAQEVRAKLAMSASRPLASEADLVAEAADALAGGIAKIGPSAVPLGDVESMPGAENIDPETKEASDFFRNRLLQLLDPANGPCGVDELREALVYYAALRAEMAESVPGLDTRAQTSADAGAALFATNADDAGDARVEALADRARAAQETVEPGSNEARDAEISAAAHAATFPLVETSDFYRAANMIGTALEQGLRSKGSWQRPLEYIRTRYAAPQWNSAAEESRDRAVILHGLRRALVTLNPEAARKLADKDIQNSLVFEASLRMYHRLEASFLGQTRVNGRTGKVLTNPVGRENARHASQFQVSAWIMSARPVAATDMVADARAQIAALRKASTSDAAKAELGLHLKMMDRLMDLVGDPTRLMEYRRSQGMKIMDEVIGSLRAGLKDVTFDDAGFMNDVEPIDVDDPDADLTPENIHTDNPRSARHLRTFLGSWRDPAVQKSLKLALTTAWQVAAMAKYYQELDVIPATAEDIAFQREMMRRHNLPKGVSAAEWAANQAIGDSNLVDDAGLVDYANQSYFIANNVDAWLSSLVRKSFGAQDNIGTMMSAENREYGAIKGEVARLENYYSFLFGDNVEDGGEILKLFRQKGEFRMEYGDVVREDHGEFVKFDNYHRKTCRITMSEDDLRTVDLFKKMLAGHANGQKETVTGVDRVYFDTTMLARGAAFYSRENVTRRWNDGKPEEEMDALEIACVRLVKQMPESVLGEDGIDLYDRFVNGAFDAMRSADRRIRASGAQTEPGSALFNSLVLGAMRKAGLVVAYNAGGKRWSDGTPVWTKGAVCIGNDAIDDLFRRSAAYAKLTSEEGGRRPEELDRDAVTEAFMDVYRKAARFAAKHPWLTHGDGRYFNAFGTALPFWRGTGVFMYNAVRANRNAAEERLDSLPDAERKFVAAASAQDAGTPVSTAPSEGLLPMLDMLADVYGIEMRGTGLRDAIAAGDFAEGSRASGRTGLVLAASATKGDVARAIYDRLVDVVWDERMNGKASKFGVARAERVLSALEGSRGQSGELFGGRVGMTDEHVFRKTGCLPANFQIGHKVHAAIDGLTNAMMSRATMINLLLTPAYDGAPVYYADPAQYCAETSGIPDEMWHQVARWWSEYNELGEHGYDPAKSGVQNAHDIFTALHEAGKDGHGRTTIGGKRYTLVSGDDGDVMSVNGWLVRDDDQLGDESSRLNALGGGEAMGYLRQFTQAGRILGFGGPATRATLHRALSWSKSMSVSFSFFFPLATKWESPIAAVGSLATMASNLDSVGKWARENPELFSSVQRMFGGRGWITKDFLGFQDIMRMMDSNDPFLSELYAWGSALGITFSERLVNPMEPAKSVVASDVNRLKELLRREFGPKVAAKFGRIADTIVLRQGDKAFAYALNATKLACVAQLAMKLRYEAQRRGKAFDPVRDLKRYGGYINAEVGGIDPLKYAWAHPANRALMNVLMFSWEWTRGAWEAGGGNVVEDMLLGGHTVTRQERAFFLGRWARMFGAVMIGVPALMQCMVMGLAKCLGGGDDDDDRWFTWQNEDKTRWTACDITPLLRAIERFDDTRLGGAIKAFKKNGGPATAAVGAAIGGLLGGHGGGLLTGALGGSVGAAVGGLVPALVPMYTGDDAANQTNRQRRYYMHFGKQGWEFFRWFDDAAGQFFSKLSMPVQRILEGVIGRNLSYLDRALPWDEQGQFERWLNPTTDGALFNLAQAFLPFTVGGLTRTGDAGFLPIFGPVQMGASQTNIQDRLEKALTAWAYNDREGYSFGVRRGKGSTLAHDAVSDILADARKNGFDPKEQLDKALGKVLTGAYGRLFRELPEDLSKPFDTKGVNEVARALVKLGTKRQQVQRSISDRLKKQGRDWKSALTPAERAIIKAVVRGSLSDPYRTKTVDPAEYDY